MSRVNSLNFTNDASLRAGAVARTIAQANHGFMTGQAVYFNGTVFALALAASPATSEVAGLVQVFDADNFSLITSGYMKGLSGLTPGLTHYLSDSTPGALSNADVSTNGHVSKPLLYALSVTEGFFINQRGVQLNNQGASLGASNPYMANSNKIINGDMQIAQRGAGGSAVFQIAAGSTQYGLDRWQVKAGAATPVTISQLQPGNPGVFWQQVSRAANSTGTGLIQVGQTISIDNARDLAGNPAYLQLKAYAGASFSSANQALTIKVVYGTGSTNVSHLSTGFVGAATQYSGTVNLSQSSQLISLNVGTFPPNMTQAYVELSYISTGVAPSNVSDGFYFTDVQLEAGTSSTAFQRKPFVQNLLDCHPYYEKSYPHNIAPQTKSTFQGLVIVSVASANSIAAGQIWGGFTFKSPKLLTPKVYTFDGVNGTASTACYYSGAGQGTTSFLTGGAGFTTPTNFSTEGFAVYNNYGAGTFNVVNYCFHYVADADFV